MHTNCDSGDEPLPQHGPPIISRRWGLSQPIEPISRYAHFQKLHYFSWVFNFPAGVVRERGGWEVNSVPIGGTRRGVGGQGEASARRRVVGEWSVRVRMEKGWRNRRQEGQRGERSGWRERKIE